MLGLATAGWNLATRPRTAAERAAAVHADPPPAPETAAPESYDALLPGPEQQALDPMLGLTTTQGAQRLVDASSPEAKEVAIQGSLEAFGLVSSLVLRPVFEGLVDAVRTAFRRPGTTALEEGAEQAIQHGDDLTGPAREPQIPVPSPGLPSLYGDQVGTVDIAAIGQRLTDNGGRLGRLIDVGKESAVYEISGDATLAVKVDQATGGAALPAKIEQEAANLGKLRELGIPTPEHGIVEWVDGQGVRRRGLLMDRIDGPTDFEALDEPAEYALKESGFVSVHGQGGVRPGHTQALAGVMEPHHRRDPRGSGEDQGRRPAQRHCHRRVPVPDLRGGRLGARHRRGRRCPHRRTGPTG